MCFVEYCTAELFEANCNPDEVIVMTSAVYGQMKIGRCVEEDIGFLGCQNDALDTMDEACSGRQACKILISKQNFRKDVAGACHRSLSGYAQMVHHCLRGTYNVGKIVVDIISKSDMH